MLSLCTFHFWGFPCGKFLSYDFSNAFIADWTFAFPNIFWAICGLLKHERSKSCIKFKYFWRSSSGKWSVMPCIKINNNRNNQHFLNAIGKQQIMKKVHRKFNNVSRNQRTFIEHFLEFIYSLFFFAHLDVLLNSTLIDLVSISCNWLMVLTGLLSQSKWHNATKS